jgi:hypothetical protein
MVKYAVMMLAVVAMFVSVDTAQARGRRGGCPGGVCYASSGCPGGVCAVPVAPAKTAASPDGPTATPVVSAQPAPRYTAAPRRLFGRR